MVYINNGPHLMLTTQATAPLMALLGDVNVPTITRVKYVRQPLEYVIPILAKMGPSARKLMDKPIVNAELAGQVLEQCTGKSSGQQSL